ncbi:COG1361 S-layer family protein [Anaeromicropila herbilytica]|uniref:CARDB domain-containing protein n=1 Tax=Anaeromicropila herbilytica TaxID=2785025 RepID=A0A7R7EP36_9FIRM|nr:hypothetical protein [Anaeromicropila herbilytica]BCN32441.1 hypothetical protein bsdtb5_37360 [Anaeromicropila herbilytica]
MKKFIRLKRWIALLLILLLSGSHYSLKVLAEDVADPVPEIILGENMDPIKAIAGSKVTVLVPVKSVNVVTKDPVISVDLKDTPFTLDSKIDMIYSTTGKISDESSIKATDTINTYSNTYVRFTLNVKETAKATDYNLTLNFKVKLLSGNKTQKVSLDPVVIEVTNQKAAANLSVSNTSYNATLESGAKFNLRLSINNAGDLAANKVKVSLDGYADDGILPNYNSSSFNLSSITGGTTTDVVVPLMVSKTAKAGKKKLTVTMKYKTVDGEDKTEDSTIYLDVIKSTANIPDVIISNTSYANNIKAGKDFNFIVSLRNKGAAKAKAIKVAVTNGYSSEGLIPNYTTEKITASDLSSGGKTKIKIPMIVSKTATSGVKTLALEISYTDSAGNDYTVKSNVYLEVAAADGVAADGKPNLIISDVIQSPSAPQAGANASVTYTIQNKSKVDIKEMKIAATNLTNANFSPTTSEPYTYVESLKAGQKKQITMQLEVSKSIPEGLNDLDVSLAYKIASGKEYTDTAKLYIRDVVNDLGAQKSKPKLIISKFSTGKGNLVAGKTFKFKFAINNTNRNISANNIKVTISSADNVFSIINGSNTFYIPTIKAGDTVEKTVQLKIKSDSVTKAYPIEVKFEYDYVGLEKVKTSSGVSDSVIESETLNIPVLENARPVVNNIAVGTNGPATVNMPTTLNFEFYNMGRSTLNNVMARVKGDFTATSNMIYIGNVEAGSSDMQEIEVTPTVEGQSKGVLVISYEDSNGDTIDKEFPFEATIQGATPMDNTGMTDMPIVNKPTAKKPIVKTWMFVLIQLVIVAGGIPIARKTTIGLYKKKLRKQEEEF